MVHGPLRVSQYYWVWVFHYFVFEYVFRLSICGWLSIHSPIVLSESMFFIVTVLIHWCILNFKDGGDTEMTSENPVCNNSCRESTRVLGNWILPTTQDVTGIRPPRLWVGTHPASTWISTYRALNKWSSPGSVLWRCGKTRGCSLTLCSIDNQSLKLCSIDNQSWKALDEIRITATM